MNALQTHVVATKCDLFLLSKSEQQLLDRLKSGQSHSPNVLLSLVCSYFNCLYGASIATCLHFSPVSVWSLHCKNLTSDTFPWLNCTLSDLSRHLHSFTVGMLADIIWSLPSFTDHLSINSCSCIKTVQGLLSHILSHAHFLLSVGSSAVTDLYLSHFPLESITSQPDEYYMLQILQCEYTKPFCDVLFDDSSQNQKKKCQHHENKINLANNAQQASLQLQSRWPTVIPKQTIFSCLTWYCEGLVWKMLPMCATCSQQLSDVQMFIVTSDSPLLQCLWCLRAHDSSITCKCTIQCMSSAFQFKCHHIDNLMLDKNGLADINCDSVKINFCCDCYNTLTNLSTNKIPRFTLANHLYHGNLPEYFSDLTWVEEKVCARYCVTSQVMCLFHSNDPLQPHVFHGNTCTHDMNVVSTASVLP